MRICTFSIVARDEETGDLGVAVQSRFIAVGAVVPYARARTGAVATQAYANTAYGPAALELLSKGKSPEEVIKSLIASDRGREERQLGIVDSKGRSATFTGKKCLEWAGGIASENYAVQGNILVSAETVEAMARTFEGKRAAFPERLLAALEAGQKAGGDRRGMQSAALIVVREGGGYGGFNDRYIDLRVDDHSEPIRELKRIYTIYRGIMLEDGEEVLLDRRTCSYIQKRLRILNYYSGEINGKFDAKTRAALRFYMDVNNLENRKAGKGKIAKSILDYLKNDKKRKI
jgi:uncharacterized Ntn-hydrolase superfamily protein